MSSAIETAPCRPRPTFHPHHIIERHSARPSRHVNFINIASDSSSIAPSSKPAAALQVSSSCERSVLSLLEPMGMRWGVLVSGHLRKRQSEAKVNQRTLIDGGRKQRDPSLLSTIEPAGRRVSRQSPHHNAERLTLFHHSVRLLSSASSTSEKPSSAICMTCCATSYLGHSPDDGAAKSVLGLPSMTYETSHF